MVLKVVVRNRSRTIENKALAARNESEQGTHLRRIPEFGSSCPNWGSSDGGVCSTGPGSRSSIMARRSSLVGTEFPQILSSFDVTGLEGGSAKPDDRDTQSLGSSSTGR